jgi:HK97 gp10 family phage protein
MVRRRTGLTRKGKDKFKKKLRSLGFQIEREAKQNAPVDTGRLRGSITTKVEDLGNVLKVKVGTNVEYAPYVEFGTLPHVITPDQAEALQWMDPETGEPVFASKVEHPGTEAQPFLLPAVDTIRASYNR